MNDQEKINLLRNVVNLLWDELVCGAEPDYLVELVDLLSCAGINSDMAEKLNLPNISADIKEYYALQEEEGEA